MKLLTIAVPCYNSQEYMHYCLQTLLAGGEEVEILIINVVLKTTLLALLTNMPQLIQQLSVPSIKKIKGMVEP